MQKSSAVVINIDINYTVLKDFQPHRSFAYLLEN